MVRLAVQFGDRTHLSLELTNNGARQATAGEKSASNEAVGFTNSSYNHNISIGPPKVVSCV